MPHLLDRMLRSIDVTPHSLDEPPRSVDAMPNLLDRTPRFIDGMRHFIDGMPHRMALSGRLIAPLRRDRGFSRNHYGATLFPRKGLQSRRGWADVDDIMPIVPSKSAEKITFFQTRNAQWTANAAAIGTTTADVSELATLTTAARAAFNTQQQAYSAARAATQALDNAVSAMAQKGAAIIGQIKIQAGAAGDDVYSLAQIPAPARPSPVGAPGTPTRFEVVLNTEGSLKLKWKCRNPAGSTGTMYQIWRRIGFTGAFTYIGQSGKREFLDDQVPAGSKQVTYQIRAVRSTAVGPWAQFNVNLGVSPGGPVSVTVARSDPNRLAA